MRKFIFVIPSQQFGKNLEQEISSLKQQLVERVTAKYLEAILNEIQENLLGQIDVNIERRIAQINQLLETTQSNYKYELVYERSGSCKVLLESLQKAQHRLILVCPWIGWAIDSKMINEFEKLLKSNISINIGWRRLQDINESNHRDFKSDSIRQKLYLSSNFYDALPKLEVLEQKYPQYLKLKILGTHAKYLVCDDCFAMLGSHNFLTSESEKKEGELGIKTNDSRIVSDLIKLFDRADDLELIAQNNMVDDIPF
ncbi:MAG: hypothetical protein CLLPBCKN_008510 [Chroococcidiopsis cubana SAG 39.79]|uniref:PLD phosphodiesterase domain-containing protein n=1 Tax=Chroococcidiopsis cubana SAG 39.79 TaxID=388085 RepID=A0AB37UAH6_9CYAN|nr:phospholipase D-like domain-containing protein [Chroococcidiopsis cubana]MDZ4879072.1 hypothetical protein [Chroococcidiopsis cubana SAG 39.79]PSB64074.1 hypothetical protein C7B79_11345 [Chroococcidiopsis cubana CCALA 043]RUT01941.1 hypothetical protein DSM107010_64130 [Chroococcidiopsis cubana SAG 39.79]